jgi:hypothetical protein
VWKGVSAHVWLVLVDSAAGRGDQHLARAAAACHARSTDMMPTAAAAAGALCVLRTSAAPMTAEKPASRCTQLA